MSDDAHAPRLLLSVVSHGQGALVAALLDDLERRTGHGFTLALTINVPETLPFDPRSFSFPVVIAENAKPKGFGANHNAAFEATRADYFCVLNPDIRLNEDPFPGLIACLEGNRAAVAAPRIVSPVGTRENNARRFPTPLSIVRRLFTSRTRIEYADAGGVSRPDWVAGMFMVFRGDAFAHAGGFDERFFLYYEDVDICARLALAGEGIILCGDVTAVHAARRTSHRDPRYLRWHLASMTRFFVSPPFRKLMWRRAVRATTGGSPA